MRRTRRLSLCALALAALPLVPVAADDVTTTAGKKVSGKLAAVDAKGVSLRLESALVDIPARDIVVVDLGNKVRALPKETFTEVELTDGSILRGAKFGVKGKAVVLDALPGGGGPTADLPTSAVFSAMKKADDAKAREDWKKMLATRGKRDLYVVAQEAGFTYIQGTVKGGSADGTEITLEKEADGKDETLRLSRCAGLVFYQPPPMAVTPTLCRVADVYGNVLIAAAVALSPEGGVSVTTVSGATVKYTGTAELARFDYALGNVAYLSDLDPQVDAPEVPLEERRLTPVAPLLRDRALSNEPLKLDGAQFPKGLCVAPDTGLTYNLKGDYSQFKATIGIDENGANATSAAKVTIEADGQVLFSEKVARKEKAKGVVLSVKGAKQLRIIVEADTPLNGNYVTFAEARVQK
jgi:hypothetical protein